MSKRLQVLLDDAEMKRIRAAARARKVSVSALTRQALLEITARDAGGDVTAKLQAVRRAAKHSFPTADIERMVEEIERGYHGAA